MVLSKLLILFVECLKKVLNLVINFNNFGNEKGRLNEVPL